MIFAPGWSSKRISGMREDFDKYVHSSEWIGEGGSVFNIARQFGISLRVGLGKKKKKKKFGIEIVRLKATPRRDGCPYFVRGKTRTSVSLAPRL